MTSLSRRAWLVRAAQVTFSVSAGGLLLGTNAGCYTARQKVALPAKHRLQSDLLRINSDVRLPKNHPLLLDLKQLRTDIADTLKLPVQQQEVVIYLFGDELRYAQYLQATYPELPARRAYFVGTTKELAVYTYWGEKVQEDLRHEYTHGVLHASLLGVPLWLDEGLAEYFEVTEAPLGMHRDYAVKLASLFGEGWQPSMTRLEGLNAVPDMQRSDYQEAWGWVHFLLHHSEETRDVLLGYVADLKTQLQPEPLSTRLTGILPNYADRFAVHTTSFTTSMQ